MLSKSKVNDIVVQTFTDFCDDYQVEGYIEENNRNEYYLVIVAPGGAKRMSLIDPIFYQEITREFNRSEAVNKLEDEILRALTWGEQKVPYGNQCTWDDFCYFEDLTTAIWNLLVERI